MMFRLRLRRARFTAALPGTASRGRSTTTTRRPSTLSRTRTAVQQTRTFSGNGNTTVRRDSSRQRSTPSSSPTATPSSSSATSGCASANASRRIAPDETRSEEEGEKLNTRSKDLCTPDSLEKKFRYIHQPGPNAQ